jgi:hypothetical protein
MNDKDKVTMTIGQLKKLVSEAMDNDVLTIPENLTENGDWQEKFMAWADEQFNGSVYDSLVSDIEDEYDGAQRDLDDWDVYRYSEQDAIDVDEFWDNLFDKISDDFDAGEKVDASDMIEFIKKAGSEVVDDAMENFEPDDDYLIHRGHWKSEAYWRS